MKLLAIGILALLVFALCFVGDKGIAFVKKRAAESKTVRMPLSHLLLSLALGLAGILSGLYAVRNRSSLFTGCALVLFGVFLYTAYNYATTGIDYDGDTFRFRRGREQTVFRFRDIDAQRVAITRGGCCLVLVVHQDEIVLYSNMQGFLPFLSHAYERWCSARGLDPAAQTWHNPADYRWFPDDEKEED